jgi:hypothetical protein
MSWAILTIVILCLVGCLWESISLRSYHKGYKDGYKRAYRKWLNEKEGYETGDKSNKDK